MITHVSLGCLKIAHHNGYKTIQDGNTPIPTRHSIEQMIEAGEFAELDDSALYAFKYPICFKRT